MGLVCRAVIIHANSLRLAQPLRRSFFGSKIIENSSCKAGRKDVVKNHVPFQPSSGWGHSLHQITIPSNADFSGGNLHFHLCGFTDQFCNCMDDSCSCMGEICNCMRRFSSCMDGFCSCMRRFCSCMDKIYGCMDEICDCMPRPCSLQFHLGRLRFRTFSTSSNINKQHNNNG